MTLEERKVLRREIFRLTWPVVAQALLDTSLFWVDTLMLGRIQSGASQALSAMGIAGPIIWTLLMIFLNALSVGTVATVARATGEKNPQKQVQMAATALRCALFAGLFCTLMGVTLLPYLAYFLSTPDEPRTAAMAIQYIHIVTLSFPFLAITTVGSAILRAAGDTKTPFIVGLIANAVNIVGDYILIFGKFGLEPMGIRGAAIATAVSYALEGAIILLALFSKKSVVPLNLRAFSTANKESFKTLFRISLPAALEPIFMHTAFILYTKLIAELGVISLAAHRAAISIESLAFMPANAFGIACAALVGQYLGAQKIGSAEHAFHESTRLVLRFMGLLALVFLIFPVPLITIFIPRETEVIHLGALCLVIVAFELPFMGFSMVLGGGLKGSGDTKSPLYVGAFTMWCVRLPCAYLLSRTFGLGLSGIWITMIIDWAVRTAIFWLIYKRGAWKKIKL